MVTSLVGVVCAVSGETFRRLRYSGHYSGGIGDVWWGASRKSKYTLGTYCRLSRVSCISTVVIRGMDGCTTYSYLEAVIW